MNKKTVFLTGASGNMGFAGFKELYAKKDKFNIVVLLRNSEKNREMFKDFANDPSVRIVWGDLTKYDDVLNCVSGSNYVLHVGGMVSPAADYYPKRTIKTNTTAMQNIVDAVKAQKNADDIRVVYIGTVAETGDRNPPIHWGRTGDPIKISIYDHYAISKVRAEHIIAESGLKHWVSLRQSGILYPGILKNVDPIMFHVPINGVLEWATIEDSGLLLSNICEDWVPENFWRKFYNIGSGQEYRITNYEFEVFLLNAIGIGSPKKLFDPNWFILKNFHGQYYADSDKLDEILHFRHNVPIKEYFDNMASTVPKYYKLSKFVPSVLIKKFLMEKLANKDVFGTMNWIKNNHPKRISAYFGSKKEWEKVPSDWKKFDIKIADMNPINLNHGYDESTPDSELTLDDMKGVAEYRGGKCLSTEMEKGDLFTPLKWQCAFGHTFEMTPNLVLKGGHWCPECEPTPWKYDEIAKVNPFFAQVWYPNHKTNENNVYDNDIFDEFGEK
jgi:nucleoside-diphosphate-sugar epimerase